MTVHPAIELALELTREATQKAGFSVPHWLGEVVLGPRVNPNVQRRMSDRFPIGSGDAIGPIQLTGGSHVGLSHTAEEGPLDQVVLADSILDHHEMWAERAYEFRSWNLWQNVLVIDVELEHGDYINLCAGNPKVPCKAWRNCAFLGIGAQAVQTAIRGWEAASYESMGEGGHLVHDYGLIRDAGRNRLWGRASFAISHHKRQWNKIEDGVFKGFEAPAEEPYQNDVLLQRQVIDLAKQSTCRGMLLADGRRRRVRLEECLFLASTLEQPLAHLREIDRLEIVGCMAHASGGQAWLNLSRVGEVVTEGNIGNIGVHRDGLDDGPLSQTR